jgi:N-acetyl-beta-hexosaminidase
MLFPRLSALAEVDWSAKDARDWDGFQGRLQVQERRLDQLGVNYHRESVLPPKTDSHSPDPTKGHHIPN